MVRGNEKAWDPQICLSWGERFLTWIKSNLNAEPEPGDVAPALGSVWRVKFTPQFGVELALLREEERREVEAGEDRVGFLPKWYYDTETQSRDLSGSITPGAKSQSEGRSSVPASAASGTSSLPTGWKI